MDDCWVLLGLVEVPRVFYGTIYMGLDHGCVFKTGRHSPKKRNWKETMGNPMERRI